MSRHRSTATNQVPQSPDSPSWRLILGGGGDLASLDGATNMAIDEALLASVKAGGAPVLRLYRWSPACLSFGRNQPTRGRYDREAAAARGIDLVRRPTGGQAVLHDDELTYAVAAPVHLIGRPRTAYARISRALVAGLSRLGVGASLAGDSPSGAVGRSAGGRPGEGPRSGPEWDAACFRRPERGEVVAGGAKLVGSAQRTESRTILQHGSILVGGSQAVAEELLLTAAVSSSGRGPGTASEGGFARDAGPGAMAAPGWTTLERELEERPSFEALAEAVRAGVEDVFGVELMGAGLTATEREAAEKLRGRYASEEWTWRR